MATRTMYDWNEDPPAVQLAKVEKKKKEDEEQVVTTANPAKTMTGQSKTAALTSTTTPKVTAASSTLKTTTATPATAAATVAAPVKTALATAGTPGNQPTATPVATEVQPKQVIAAQPVQATSQASQTSPAVQELLTLLKTKLNKTPVTGAEIQGSPEYQAQAAIIENQRGRTLAANRRALASRGTLRSTPAIQALGDVEANYDVQLGALTPQMMQVAYGRAQDELRNIESVLKTFSAEDQAAFNRGITEAGITGIYQNNPTWQRQMDEANLTGTYAGNSTLAGRRDAREQGLYEYDLTARQLQNDIDALTLASTQRDDPIKAEQAKLDLQRKQAEYDNYVSTTGRQKVLDELEVTKREIDNRVALLKEAAMKETDPNAKELAAIELKKAQADLDKVNADIKRIEAETGAANALANERNANASQPKEPKKTQAQIDSDNRRNDIIDDYTRNYNISRIGAEAWAELLDAWSEGNVPLTEKQSDLDFILANKPGLSAIDQEWVRLMYASTNHNNPFSQEQLNKPPYRKQDITK